MLRTSLPGLPPLIAGAENSDITRALCDAKRELIRQIEHQKSVRVPMNNRQLSATIRHPDTSARPQTAIQKLNQQLAPANRETDTTHITEARVIGKNADIGRSAQAVARIPLTVNDVLRDHARRRARRTEIIAAQST